MTVIDDVKRCWSRFFCGHWRCDGLSSTLSGLERMFALKLKRTNHWLNARLVFAMCALKFVSK